MPTPTPFSYLEVSASALQHNLRALSRRIKPGVKRVAVVKGNAYGHGLEQVVHCLDRHVDAFQIDDIEELRQLRAVSTERTLVFGYIPARQVEEAIALNAELTLYDAERIPALEAAAKSLGRRPKVHLKVDALLGRQGILPQDVSAFLERLANTDIDVVGVYAHFANIEDTTDLTHANAQAEAFEGAFRQVRTRYPDVQRHLSATSGLLTLDPPADLVRIGIGLYGLYPSLPLERTHAELGLRPVARWISGLAQAKMLPAGHPVGYGLTYVTSRPTRLGIVPQGYADGFDRGLSNSGEVLVGGQRCPVIGRVAMNMIAIDLRAVPHARPEDEVVLLGAQGEEVIRAEEVAARLGTIHYEVVTRISPLLPRVLV